MIYSLDGDTDTQLLLLHRSLSIDPHNSTALHQLYLYELRFATLTHTCATARVSVACNPMLLCGIDATLLCECYAPLTVTSPAKTHTLHIASHVLTLADVTPPPTFTARIITRPHVVSDGEVASDAHSPRAHTHMFASIAASIASHHAYIHALPLASDTWNAQMWYKEALRLISCMDRDGHVYAMARTCCLTPDFCPSLNYVLSLIETATVTATGTGENSNMWHHAT